MTVINRNFGKSPSLNDSLPRGKEFTDMAMKLDIDEVLNHARRKNKVGHSAARLSGVGLQHEGDYDSQRLVYAAYDGIYDMMRPSFVNHGSDATGELFNLAPTRATILDLSNTLSSYGFSTVAHAYAQSGNFLEMTEAGLVKQEGLVIPKKFETIKGGCPYAHGDTAPYFNQLTDRVVETYVEADKRGMPHGWLGMVSRR